MPLSAELLVSGQQCVGLVPRHLGTLDARVSRARALVAPRTVAESVSRVLVGCRQRCALWGRAELPSGVRRCFAGRRRRYQVGAEVRARREHRSPSVGGGRLKRPRPLQRPWHNKSMDTDAQHRPLPPVAPVGRRSTPTLCLCSLNIGLSCRGRALWVRHARC
jgi:hypothetical protein